LSLEAEGAVAVGSSALLGVAFIMMSKHSPKADKKSDDSPLGCHSKKADGEIRFVVGWKFGCDKQIQKLKCGIAQKIYDEIYPWHEKANHSKHTPANRPSEKLKWD
jgi:hypothetical protein